MPTGRRLVRVPAQVALVEAIESDDPSALIGLPLITVIDLLRLEGLDVLAASADEPR